MTPNIENSIVVGKTLQLALLSASLALSNLPRPPDKDAEQKAADEEEREDASQSQRCYSPFGQGIILSNDAGSWGRGGWGRT